MKLTKKLITEIEKFLASYWESYISGDLDKWSSYLPEDYRNIGTTNEEIWNSRQEILDYTISVLDQMIGMAEVRNRKVDIIPYKGYFMTHELGDLYVKSEDGWNFYAPIRLSSLLEKTNGKWQVLHQHGSYPDSRTTEGEAFAFDALKAENKKLQAAVEKRTKELVVKNWELAVEASLERVRTVAMGMTKPEDLLGICKVLYKEFKGLGFKNLRNTMVNLHDDQTKSLENYDYSGKAKGSVTRIAYESHPATKNIVQQLKKSNNAFGSFSLKGKKLDEWRDYRKSLGEKDDPLLNTAKVLSYYFYSIGSGSIGISSYSLLGMDQIALLERFRNVFELAYRRFTDIQKAEAQTREAQIEAGLERVRSRSLAMHNSNELEDVIIVVLKTLGALGIDMESRAAAIFTFEKDSKDYYQWAASEEYTSVASLLTPYVDHPVQNDIWNARKIGIEFFAKSYTVEEKNTLFQYFFDHTALRFWPEENKKRALDFNYYDVAIAFEKNSAVCVVSHSGVALTEDENELIRRFSKVFEQAYIRFLDLQKAETQVREAQIEAALERTRAQSMLMQHSSELNDISKVFHEQLHFLGIDSEFSHVWLPDEPNSTHMFWATWSETAEGKKDTVSKAITYDLDKSEPYTAACFTAWESEEPVHIEFVPPEGVGTFFSTWKALFRGAKKLKARYFKSGIYYAEAYMKYGCFGINIRRALEEEEQDILRRFTVEFERAYTRFLDLQKAEAQAREAQIEAALERIRARSMAMHKSEELADLSLELVKQVKLLGEATWFCAFNIYDDDPRGSLEWGSNGEGTFPNYRTPREGVFLEYYKAGQKGDSLLINEIGSDECPAHYDYLCTLPGVGEQLLDMKAKGIPFPESQIDHVAYFKYGYLLFITYDPAPELHNIFVRFSKVFEQSYTRFLDLQQAEAQAQEAEIELALERVRARSMAMQISEELKEVVKEIFDQMALLNINAEHAGIVVDYEPKQDWHFWVAESQDIPAKITVPYLDSVWDRQFTSAQKKGLNFFTTELNFEEKNSFYNKLLPNIPGLTKKSRDFYFNCPGLAISTVIQKDIGLYIENFSGSPYSEKENDTLMRFGKVFQQTYTRFLDLQKAEVQAREAEIELALERVRARTMAMLHSDELGETSFELFEQFKKLGNTSEQISIGIFEDNGKTLALYSTLYGAQWQDPVTVNLDEPVVMNKIRSSWKKKKPSLIIDLSGEKLMRYNKFRKKLSHFDYHEKRWIIHCAFFTKGVLTFSSTEPLPPETFQLLERFAGVFNQTYTRFLDLQRAEAQVREAQIEASLERVRAKSMAMHTSENLLDTISEFFTQLKLLDVVPVRCGVAQMLTNPPSWIWTATNATTQGDSVQASGLLTNLGHPVLQSIYDNWVDQENYFPVLKGKDLRDYYKVLREELTIPEFTRGEVHYGHYFNFKEGNIFAWTTEPLRSEEVTIFERFSLVLSLTYRRYLDLQKAEAQVREAQIEAALERVRSRSMAMHSSSELAETALVLFQQLRELGIKHDRTNIGIVDEANGKIDFWLTTQKGNLVDKTFSARIDESNTLRTIYKGYKDKKKSIVVNQKGAELKKWISFITDKLEIPYSPPTRNERRVQTVGYISHGMLIATSTDPLNDESLRILERFAAVFDQTYTRFLDLKNAEAQALEAKIEAALEKVRSRAMAMQKGEELKEVVVLLYKELMALGVTNFVTCGYVEINEKTNRQETWVTNPGGDSLGLFYLPLTGDVHFDARYEAWKKQKAVFHQTVAAEERKKHLEYAITTFNSKEAEEMVLTQFPDPCVFYCFNFSHGYLHLVTGSELKNEEELLMARFTKVFEQAYTRFLDLQKAEAQAREAQIEAVLERVRSRTMGMQQSSEMPEVANNLFQQVQELGFPAWSTGYCIWEEDKTSAQCSMSSEGLIQKSFSLPTIGEGYDFATPMKNGENFHVAELGGKALVKHYEFMRTLPVVSEILDGLLSEGLELPTFQIFHIAYFKHGYLMFITYEPVPEGHDIFKRFAAVFDQTYTRFQDLKKAEDQARESQIELSLERIRAQATAMKVSSDLLDIVVTMRTEFVGLGFEAHFFWHMRWLPEKYEKAMTGGDGSRIGMVMTLPRHIHGDIDLVDTWEKGEEPSLVFPMDVETAVPYIDKMITLGDFEQVDPNAPTLDDVRHIGGLTFIMARTTHGEIGYSLPGEVPNPPAEAITTLTRFAGAFDLAYRRFEDLKQAEAREKEAIKDASLDRVRAEIASMRSPKDLERITPLVWKELTTLGVPFFRCGIFIIKEDEEMVHAYLSTPAGESLAALHISFDETEIGMIVPSIDNWRNQTVYREEWDQKRFLENMQLFMKRGDVKSTKKYQDGDKPPEKLVLHLVPFKQGMLYVGNSEPLVQEHIDLMQDLATAFSIAYSRYEDFVQLEEAKKKVDLALTDLKSAQSQLIHAEKMASLGELTAGIAHEIQNPLNFVNNFSEVNKELMEELVEELLNGDYEEAKAIAQDIMDNDTKIMHHGKRAEGIVKGMLQHSRSSSGEKELTDINQLADEYLRLSYHGLRAKDKSFNADFELELDKSLPKVNVIPQDIGRVLLNLVNNAFYAVSDVEKPKVIVKTEASPLTKGGERGVVITVSDNGSGIPEQVRDKIFQPFFTTKATGEGTGLGLSLSYDIVTKGHSGKLEVKTVEGEGSKFIITLPN